MSESPAFTCAVCRQAFQQHPFRNNYCPACRRRTVDERDLRIDVYRAANNHIAFGVGTDPKPAVRVTHLPTGIAVLVNDQDTRRENRNKAVAKLLERLSTRLPGRTQPSSLSLTEHSPTTTGERA